MLTKTSTAVNLLDMMEELELLEVSMLVDGEWLRLDDRASLYRAAIVALMECAETEGFNVMSTALMERLRPTEIEIEEATCDQLDGGCTCESCSQQIIDAVGMSEIYVKDDDGHMHGPYSNREDAEHDADRIHGIVVES